MGHREVLIAEDSPDGHRLVYVRLLADAAMQQQWSVTLLLGFDEKTSEEYAAHLEDLSSDFTIVRADVVDLMAIRRYARDNPSTHMVVPTGDRIAMQLGRSVWCAKGCTMSILVMRDPAAERTANVGRRGILALKSLLLLRAGRMRGVRIYRLRSAGVPKPSDGGEGWLSDPVTSHQDPRSNDNLRRTWGITTDIFWFGVLGAISERKNVPLVLRALRNLHQEVGLLIAGRPSDDSFLSAREVSDLRSFGITVVQIPRTLSSVEIDSAVALVDCIAILHSNEGPSGILGKAAALGTWVVAGGAQSLRQNIQDLGFGEWVQLNTPMVTRAFANAMRARAPIVRTDPDITDFLRLLR